MDELAQLDKQNIWHPFTSLADATELPVIVRGEGAFLITSDGRRILDGISSWWVNLHGHANPIIAKAIAGQAMSLEQVIFAGFTHPPAIRLSQNLLSILPRNQKKIFFSDNGSTAVEVGIKMAIQYWHNLGVKKKRIVAIRGAYHGDTFGSMSVAERGLFNKPFFSYLFETTFIDLPQKDNERNVVEHFRSVAAGGDVAAFIFEPLVQAAGGMRMYSPQVLDELIACAHDQKIVCIADEVFTGFGRTGKNFAIDHLNNKPDIIALSKGITGGFMPLGVTTCSHNIAEAFTSDSFEKTFFHGHSYTANPLACAAANASFELLTSDACQHAIVTIEKKHIEFADSLRGIKSVAEVRVRGTILAVELKSAEGSAYENSLRKKIYPYFLERDILLRPLGNVIYLLPPYVIRDEDLQRVYRTIRDFVDQLM
jgi:adenosylmethionine-8-amino-7-oxononanoate aminotransferase